MTGRRNGGKFHLAGKFCPFPATPGNFALCGRPWCHHILGVRHDLRGPSGLSSRHAVWRIQLGIRDISCRAVLGLALALPATLQADAGQARSDFAPHRALYSMSLGETQTDSGVTDVEGRMAFEWREDCDGWIVEQRYAMRYFGASSAVHEIDTTFSTWESKDGKRYRFFVTNKPGGSTPPKIEGFASHPGQKGTGMARFTVPEEADFELSKTVLFPSAHTFAMIDAALGGGKFFAAPMFDGSEVEGPTSVSAVMGKERLNQDADDALLRGKHWPVRMAFFGADSKSSEPSYEMSATMHSNGIASDLVLDYGDFTVNVTLKTLEALPKPSC